MIINLTQIGTVCSTRLSSKCPQCEIPRVQPHPAVVLSPCTHTVTGIQAPKIGPIFVRDSIRFCKLNFGTRKY
jgi:hypothetical protein